MNDCPVPFPTGASVDAILSLGDFIYSVHTKAKMMKSTYGVSFFDQSAHKAAVNKAQKSIIKQSPFKQDQKEITRAKKSDWYISVYNKRCTRSIDDFLVRLKKNGPDSFQIYFEKINPQGTKISTLSIYIEKKSNTDYLTRLELASNSKNEEIYNNFKKFGLDHKLTIAYGDYGKDNIITLTTANFSNPAELAPYIQLCNEFDPTIPIEILDNLKTACHIPLIPSQEEFEKIIHNNGFEHALKLANDCSNRELFLITLADTLFKIRSYKDATSCYQLITTNDRNLYKKAQYQLGSIILNSTEIAEYDSRRDRACASLSYFIEAMDYLDSPDLLRQVFNCLCTGSYAMNVCPAPFPTGASVSSILLLGDYIYSVQKKSNLIYKETESEKPSSAIRLGK